MMARTNHRLFSTGGSIVVGIALDGVANADGGAGETGQGEIGLIPFLPSLTNHHALLRLFVAAGAFDDSEDGGRLRAVAADGRVFTRTVRTRACHWYRAAL